MIGYQTIVEQGWSANRTRKVSLQDCPYPQGSMASKEWYDGWYRFERGEHWKHQPRRKVKKEEE